MKGCVCVCVQLARSLLFDGGIDWVLVALEILVFRFRGPCAEGSEGYLEHTSQAATK